MDFVATVEINEKLQEKQQKLKILILALKKRET